MNRDDANKSDRDENKKEEREHEKGIHTTDAFFRE